MCFIKLYEFQFNHVTLTGLRKVAKKHPMKMMMSSLDARPVKSQDFFDAPHDGRLNGWWMKQSKMSMFPSKMFFVV